ncbi:hypothetical protein RHS01_01362 [Rhizoctonia solani]|uniref:Uncharacterized protein n=1 Tax=Rhizoctonia solani TaxID=456999 RepID=A0A8H7M9M7_9AGAM|nr:hypothetical protein RHS01_01362 [Rhizoctonia solani]
MEIRPGKSPTPEEDEDPNPTRDRTFTSAPRPSIPTSGRVRIPGHRPQGRTIRSFWVHGGSPLAVNPESNDS